MLKNIAIVFLVMMFMSSFSYAGISVDIPLEHPIYNNIDRLSNLGVFSSDFASIRPITMDRLQNLFDQVEQSKIQNKQVQRDLDLIRNYLAHENKNGVLQFNTQQGAMYSNAKPLRLLETDATTNPLLNQKDQSRFKAQGYQLWMQPRMYFNWNEWAAFDIEPFIGMTENMSNHHPQRNIYLRKAILKTGFRDFEVSVGRMPLQWTHGFTGGLMYGGAQHPMDMIQLRNTSPVQLPSFLKIFGLAQFSAFVSRMDSNQVIPESIVIGERLVIKPHSILEMGFSQSVQFMGKGAPSLSFTDILSEVIGKRLPDINSENLSNRHFVIDGSIKIPPLGHTKLYAELFWEDCCEFPFDRDLTKLFGILYPELWGSKASIGFEYIQTKEIYNRHRPYLSGFINRGTTLGHQLGPDAEGYYLKYHHVISDSFELDLINGYEIRARNQLNQKSEDIRDLFPLFEASERRIRHVLKLQKTWRSRYWATLSTGYERIWDSEYFQGQDRNQYLAQLETGFSF